MQFQTRAELLLLHTREIIREIQQLQLSLGLARGRTCCLT